MRNLLGVLARRGTALLLAAGLLGGLALASQRSDAAPPKKALAKNLKNARDSRPLPANSVKRVAVPRSAILTNEAWQKAPRTPVRPGEIDALVAKELEQDQIKPAPLTTDEQFIRRVTLDLTGQLPVPADVSEFVANSDPQKRAKLIDQLLASEEFARHWGRYWRDVIGSRATDQRSRIFALAFENWMTEQIQKNVAWDKVARAMITAAGEINTAEPDKNGEAFLLLSHRGPDANNERTAEVSRVFLGIQIQCAQCHDHPSDQWKQVQFHEFAGYFARMRERQVRKGDGFGMMIVSLPRGEHEMPGKEDPKKTTITHPRFLTGQTPPANLSDEARRKALADAITDKNNYWFAGAYANRVWGELMGQSFYQPVDDMGPMKEAVFPGVLTRLAAAFRATNYDQKAMFRAILNSQTYQRQIRLGEASDEHLHFAAAYPTRLRADALWDSLVNVLGQMGGRGPQGGRGAQAILRNRFAGLEGLFKLEFDFDPSLKADEIENSIPQALLMMNNPTINQRIEARGSNLLARILTAYPRDDDALRMVYLRTLARKPTDRELAKCRDYIKTVDNRAEAFEDILWALINSTEFQTKR